MHLAFSRRALLADDMGLGKTVQAIAASASLAFARMPRVEARGGMATGDRGVALRAKTGLPRHSFATAEGFGAVPLGFATDAPRGSAGNFT